MATEADRRPDACGPPWHEPRGARIGLSGVITMAPQARLGSPEGMRADRPSRRTTRAGALAALVLFALLLSVAIGGEPARLTVANHTPHALDVSVAGRIFRDLAPGASATYETSRPATLSVNASYAAGQGVQGSAQRSFYFAPAPGGNTTRTSYVVFIACHPAGPVAAPVNDEPIVWKVTADTLVQVPAPSPAR